jgi:hypothetical protein
MLGIHEHGARFVALQAVLIIGLFTIGCGGENANQKEKRLLKEYGQAPRTLANLAGKVTVDGLPPAFGPEHPLQVILYDLKHPPTRASSVLHVICAQDGSFQFMKSATEPGAPEGSYVILFAALKQAGIDAYKAPDALKNLYNDPDKNQQDPSFKIDLTAPGKTDYEFDLKLADKPAVAAPGPHAITHIGFLRAAHRGRN